MGNIRVGRIRSISRPVGPGVTQHQAHGTRCGSPAARRRDIQDDGTAARRWQAVAADRLSPDSSVVAPVATDHCDRLRVIANRASSCLYCPGPGDENVGPLALATIPMMATDYANHPDVATIPTMGTEDEKSLVLADDDLPMAGNCCCHLAEAGCYANGSQQAIRNPDHWLRHPPGPGTEPYGQLTMRGWRNSRRTSCSASANLGGAARSCSGYINFRCNGVNDAKYF